MAMPDFDSLIAKVDELVRLIALDEGGMPAPAPSGNGGLLGIATIQCANDVRKMLARMRVRQ